MRWRPLSLIGLALFLLFGNFFFVSPAAARPPKDGVVREYYPNGRLKLEVKYHNEKQVFRRQYNRDGQLLLDYRYKNGQPYYKRESYPDGQIRSLWTKKSGVLINYDRKGGVKSTVASEGLRIEQP